MMSFRKNITQNWRKEKQMWQNDEAKELLKSVEDLLQYQEKLLESMNDEETVEMPVVNEPDDYIKELSEMFTDDKELVDLLTSIENSSPEKVFNETLPQSVKEEDLIIMEKVEDTVESEQLPVTEVSNEEEEVLVNREVELSNITEKQLRALSRRHLMLMILDLQEDLNRTREEKEDMLIAYKAGLSKRIQKD